MSNTRKVPANKKTKSQDDRTDKTSVEEWQRQFTASIVQEIHNLIEEQKKIYGHGFGELARLNVITSLIASAVYGALIAVPKENARDLKSPTTRNTTPYRDIRESIQNVVESAFEGAAVTWTGKRTEYYCTVDVVPEPISQEIN